MKTLMSNTSTSRTLRKRIAGVAILFLGGAGISAGAWFGKQHGLAIGLLIFYVVSTVVAYVWSGRSTDVAALLALQGDERQRTMDLRATAFSGVAMAGLAVTGTIGNLAQGGDGAPWVYQCAVGGAAYVGAFIFIKMRNS